jgi:hypothetical protein
MPSNFGDFQMGVYLDAVKGVRAGHGFASLTLRLTLQLF